MRLASVAAASRPNADQTSMAEAERRQRDESEGMSSGLISLASSRSVCSLEKLVTSMKAQKLPRVNSGGGDVSIQQQTQQQLNQD